MKDSPPPRSFLKGQCQESFHPPFYDSNLSELVIHTLKYFRICFRYNVNICMWYQ